jgi:hypothetical protein
VVTPEVIAAVEAIVKETRRVTVTEIAAHLDMSHGSAHHIVHDKNKKKYLRLSFDTPSYFPTFRPSRIVGDLSVCDAQHPRTAKTSLVQIVSQIRVRKGAKTLVIYTNV